MESTDTHIKNHTEKTPNFYLESLNQTNESQCGWKIVRLANEIR